VASGEKKQYPHPRVFLRKSSDLLDFKGVMFFQSDKEFVISSKHRTCEALPESFRLLNEKEHWTRASRGRGKSFGAWQCELGPDVLNGGKKSSAARKPPLESFCGAGRKGC